MFVCSFLLFVCSFFVSSFCCFHVVFTGRDWGGGGGIGGVEGTGVSDVSTIAH